MMHVFKFYDDFAGYRSLIAGGDLHPDDPRCADAEDGEEFVRLAEHQSDLAALREELAGANRRLGACINQIEEQQQRLAAAEQRNAELTQALERGKLWLELFRAWFGDYGVSQEDHAAITRTLRGLPHPPSEFDKPTESGASE